MAKIGLENGEIGEIDITLTLQKPYFSLKTHRNWQSWRRLDLTRLSGEKKIAEIHSNKEQGKENEQKK